MINEYYDWQKKIINHNGNITIKGGRQTGKSEATAARIKRLAEEYPGCRILITSPSERQENYLYDKLKALFGERYKYKKRLTLKEMHLRNGTIIFKYPIGRTGMFVEGLASVDFIFIDEAMHMTQRSWDAILPMLAEPRGRGLGWITMLSNTRGKPFGAFYDSFKDPSFEKVSISSEDVPHIPKEYLEAEKIRLGESRYKMIWLGEFVETDFKYFTTELIDKVMTLKSWHFAKDYNPNKRYVCGIDPARFGRDKAAIISAEINEDKCRIVHKETIKKCSLKVLMDNIEGWHRLFHYTRFYIDGLGIGAGLVDFMKEKFGMKVIEINNSYKGTSGRLKEDLYSNLRRLMELGRIEILYDEEIRESLLNIEYDGEEFSGEKSDIAEAMIRAAWELKERHYTPKIF